MLGRMPQHPWVGLAPEKLLKVAGFVRKVNKYLPHYAPGAGKPVFEDGDMFTVTVPLGDATQTTGTPAVTPTVSPTVTPTVGRLLQLLESTPECGSGEIRHAFGLRDRVHIHKSYLMPALDLGLVEMTRPDKPNSRLQKYRLTAKGRAALERQGGREHPAPS